MKRLMLTTAFLLLALVIKAQTVISGKVTDLNGQPLAHVSVMVEGTEVQTVTNEDGQFTLKMHEQPPSPPIEPHWLQDASHCPGTRGNGATQNPHAEQHHRTQ